MELLITIVGSVLVGLITTEIIANVPRISKWLIGGAALRLPDHARDHYREEWLAHLEELPGSLGKLRHALACRYKAPVIRAALSKPNAEALKIAENITKYIFRARILPLIFQSLIRGRINNVRFAFKVTDHLVHIIFEYKLKRNATDAQVKRITRSFLIEATNILTNKASTKQRIQ